MNSTRRTRLIRIGAAVGVAAVALLTTIDPAGAAVRRRERPPALTINGSGTWTIREWINDAVVNGTTEVVRNGGKGRTTELAATVDTDDGTFPAPGECESGVATVTSYGGRNPEIHLIGGGEICALFLQPPTSIVKYAFTGTYEVLEGPCGLRGTDGFFEVRLADDGSASVFAIDT